MIMNTSPRPETVASLRRLPPAIIRQYGQTIEMPDVAPASLYRKLTTLRHMQEESMSSGLQVVKQRESLIQPTPPRPNAGLEVILSYEMLRRGYRPITVRHPHVQPLPAPAVELIEGKLPVDDSILNAVQSQQHGLIQYHPGVSPVWVIVQMVQAWPRATFSVATATFDQAKRLHRAFYRHGIKSSLATARSWPNHPKRVVVGTYTALADPEVQKRDIFIAASAAHALGEHGQRCLLHPDARYRLFGLLSRDHHLSPWEQDWLVATFGPERITMPAHGYQETQPSVVWVPFRWHDDSVLTGGMLTIKQELVWQHHVRNRRIARLAKTLAAGDMAAFSANFPRVAGGQPGDHPSRVMVLVDSVEHALAIADRLPGWPIITADTNEQYLAQQRRSLWNTGANMIVTAAGADRIDIGGNGTTVVIWASAGRHLPPLPPAWRTVPAGEARDLLVVDIQDRGHGNLAAWTRRRKKEYERAEWLPPGTNRLAARIRRFLENRPRRAAQ